VVGGYVTGNLLISVICGTVTTAVLAATSVPYPIALGVVVAVLDLIPLVGATIGTVIVVAVALSTRGVWPAAAALVVMLLYQQIENNALQQLVYHRTVKISPLAIALSVAIGVEIGGIVGALLAIPAAGALKVVSGEILGWRRAPG
jgi:predicted PurR-regulated permease PerM